VQGHIHILAANGSGGSSALTLLFPVIIIAAFYFLLIRPQRNRQKQQVQMQKAIEPGARILTTSGMYATVVEVTDDGLVLEIAPGVEAEFVNQAIMRVVEEEEAVDEAEDDEETAEAVEDDTPAEGDVNAEAIKDTETAQKADSEKADKSS
jgi:preprotein translocase subunit YajC